jgi:uroporphyrinogen-III synthase
LHAALNNLGDYAMVSFVSPNAIAAAFAAQKNWPRELTLSVMGEGSRSALAHHGVNADTHNIVSPKDLEQTDSQTLLKELDLASLRGKKVLIVRGESGRELLADELRAAGVIVTQVAAYRRVIPELDVARRAQLMALVDSQNDWIITSSEALRNLIHLVQQLAMKDGVAKMQQQKIIVPHARIAETARALGFHDIRLTGSGDEHVVAALQSCS